MQEDEVDFKTIAERRRITIIDKEQAIKEHQETITRRDYEIRYLKKLMKQLLLDDFDDGSVVGEPFSSEI